MTFDIEHAPLDLASTVGGLSFGQEASMSCPQVVMLSVEGQLALPPSIQAAAGLHPGSLLEVTFQSDGTVRYTPIEGTLPDLFHALDGLHLSGPLDVDEAILQSVLELDNAARGH